MELLHVQNGDSFFLTKCGTVYYKLRQVLQSAMIISNGDSTTKSHTGAMPRRLQKPFCSTHFLWENVTYTRKKYD